MELRITCTLDLDNSATLDHFGRAAALKNLAAHLHRWNDAATFVPGTSHSHPVRDLNGNTIGTVTAECLRTSADSIHDDEPADNGRHPTLDHLIYIELEPHHGSYLATTPAAPGSLLVSEDDARTMLGDRFGDDDGDLFGYVSDEYLDLWADKATD
jgi:hypothetical protein